MRAFQTIDLSSLPMDGPSPNDLLDRAKENLSIGGLQISMATMKNATWGCERLRTNEEGEQIHGLVLKIGFGSDVYVQSNLVSFYSKCGKITSARKVFDGMVEKDLVCWNSLIDGYVKCGEVDMAREVFDGMLERDSFSWTVWVDGYSKRGEIEVARGFFDRMLARIQ
ncbi:putative pentatricopeptide repeat-containing protein At5g37570 [Magnolia sinica]|uniref:putative pentatricopeptide repeat-containing protein At5g37570 n=1 Tax=Magnolia sinica TaxID=86752 RepID=UPI002658F33C|nr:putative pentatricopeptide repeat-containing protein At5g37570 [Magnolia sinica]